MNIILDDIDREFEERLPKHEYARFIHEIFIPIYDKDLSYNDLKEIFTECNFLSPTFARALRGGEPIAFSGGLIRINNEGMCQIEYG